MWEHVFPCFVFSSVQREEKNTLREKQVRDGAGLGRDNKTACKIAVILIPIIQMRERKLRDLKNLEISEAASKSVDCRFLMPIITLRIVIGEEWV